ncbi:mitochondrial matrix Mmp37 [Lipomyces arxii]|uniref:mitochondrial matrix Mmp37 n=1 Tax=Lipomyces arxii TaxID=56418 RepID=UPI0034CF3012
MTILRRIFRPRKLVRLYSTGKPTSGFGVRSDLDDISHDVLIREITRFSQLPEHFGVNQHIPIDDDVKERLRQTLWMFKAPIRYAFAYGSGVFSQGQTYARKPQVDLIFGVSYSQHWHSLNMAQYPEHYSSLRWLGSGAVSFVQDRIGAGVYFNPYIELNGMTIKYGVVTIDTICKDLLNWDTLYLSGRLHKPVKILRDDPRVRLANQRNLFSVIRTALLLLPERFTETELYTTIASLSYMGDPRMQVGAENPNKVANIVANQMQNFYRLYAPLIDTLPNVGIVGGHETDNVTLAQDMDPARRGNMVARLPASFKARLYGQFNATVTGIEYGQKCTEVDQKIAGDPELETKVRTAISKTVKWPSMAQSVKGLATAGVYKSWVYMREKIAKRRGAQM